MITGASSGIGEATAKILAAKGHHLIITGRRDHLLQTLKNKLENEFRIDVHTLCFDVRDQKQVDQALDGLPKDWENIDVLLNNAGLAKGFSDIQDGEIEDWENMIDTNIKGLLYVSRKIMPRMINKRSGQIINVGSIAGKEVYAKGNVYCATKHAVEGITKAMRMDLLQHGIRVSAVCPGAVETEFSNVRFNGDDEKADAVYQGYQPLMAQDIAEAIEFMISRPAHVNVNDLLIMPTAQASSAYLLRK